MIEVKNLTKRYGKFLAIENLNFTVEDGRIYGFLGPNGAGKSTTMNILTGCLAATEGTVTVDGFDIFEDPIEAKRRIGYLPEVPPLYVDMTAMEYLRFVAEAKGVAKKELDAEITRAADAVDLGEKRDRLIKNLSKGYRQRVGIAQAMLGNPSVIILDEPTVGLDPAQIIEIRDLIRKLGERHTVIISSHILSEISEVCDRVLILSHGKLIANETLDNLNSAVKSEETLLLVVKGAESEIRFALDGMEGADELTTAPSAEGDGVYDVRIRMAQGFDLREEAFRRLAGAGLVPLSINIEKSSLEDIFLQLTEDAPASANAAPDANDTDDGVRDIAPDDESTLFGNPEAKEDDAE